LDLDSFYMKRALEISTNSWGQVSPNPYVGCVIVKENQIIAEGWHQRIGGPHAEIEALKIAGDAARGAIMYVSLEPCCHYGKTGPCTEAIINADIKKVVYATEDPNPLVAGKGKSVLLDAGLEVVSGVLEEEAQKINEVFFFNQKQKRPFVALKAALTLDGKMATSQYESKWITGEEARRKTHELRAGYDAILIGAGTLEADNPQLTVREGKYAGKNPIRIVIGGRSRKLDFDSQIFDTSEAQIWLVFPQSADFDKRELLAQKGVRVFEVEDIDGKILIYSLLEILYQEGIKSIFVEGGSQIHTSFLEADVAERVYLFFAPKLIGGEKAPGLWNGAGESLLSNAKTLEDISIEKYGIDVLISGRMIGGGMKCLPD